MKAKIAILFFPVLLFLLISIWAARNVDNTNSFSQPQKSNDQQPKIGDKTSFPLKLPQGFSIGIFATNLKGVRDLHFTPNGTLIVTLPSIGEVVALADHNRDGVADNNKTILDGLQRPHGLAFYNGKLFVAQETSVARYNFDETTLTATFDKKLFDLPTGGRHRTRSIVFDKKGNLFVSLGSTCDTCVEKHPFISTVLISDSEGKTPKVFSKGLRNAVFLAVNPTTDKVWVTEMGRDFLGDTTPPDEINILSENGNYGWPYCYGDITWDQTFRQKNQEFCNTTLKPFYKIPAHSAPLGLAFINSSQFPSDWQGDLLVAYHGSWNRSTPTGYKIVRITTKGKPKEFDFLTGFLDASQAKGRPVDVIFDQEGSMYVSDDKANSIYKIIKQ